MSEDDIPDWDISALVKSTDPESIKQKFSEVLKRAKQFQTRFKGKIKALDGNGLQTAIIEFEELSNDALNLRVYAYLNFDVNADNPEAQALNGASQVFYSEFERGVAFFELEISRLLKDNTKLIEDSVLQSYRYYLEKLHEKGSHMLSEAEEQLIIEKRRFGADAWQQLQSEIRGATRRRVTIDGEEKELALMELFLMSNNSPDRERRLLARRTVMSAMEDEKRSLSYAYRSICGNYATEMKNRGWPDSLSPTLHIEGITKKTLDTMQKVIFESVTMIKEYFKIKAKLMGIEKIAGVDLWAPISELDKKYSWQEARHLVVGAYREFDSAAAEYVDSHFTDNRIDARARPGKVSFGACASSYRPNLTWIVLNYTGALYDMVGLAHEGGHGFHSYLSASKNSFLNWRNTSSCLAETASTFGELLLLDQLLSSGDTQTKIATLCKQLDNYRLMTLDMLYRFKFETESLNAVESGKYLDADTICSLYTDARTEVFGDSIDWLPESKWQWAFVIHNFITSYRYYNFSYSFGELLVFNLYRRYREEGNAFKPKIIGILEAGGSKSTTDILEEVGFDISSRSFWEGGVSFAKNLLEELKGLVDT